MLHKKLRIATVVLVLIVAQLGLHPSARAATYTVTNTNDSGPGSLRQAIIDANFPISIPPHLIKFNIDTSTDPGCNAGTGVCTIQPTSGLPALTGGNITIDGYTQTGAMQATATTPAALKIVIDGSSAGVDVSGLTINSANNTIRGLVINEFFDYGILIYGKGATGNTISGNHVGTDVSGTTESGNGEAGICISDGAQNNTVGSTKTGTRNIISGNDHGRVRIRGSDTMNNTVSGNYIGTDASGTAALSNGSEGVRIYDGAQNNIVGGSMAGARNLISGNGSCGVGVTGSGTMGNTISGNYIGTDISATTVLSNTSAGIAISSAGNTVGGDTVGEQNVISGNGGVGIRISGDDATGNVISGNIIGLAGNGMDPLGNDQGGVYLYIDSQNTTIGGDTAGERNVISSNGGVGITIYTSHNNTVSGNYIGTDASGTLDRGNTSDGIHIGSSSQNNVVGGDTVGERNVISGNDGSGLVVRSSGAMYNTVLGNYIGTAANGVDPLGNAQSGVDVEFHTQNNTVGPGNIVAHNGGDGVRVHGSDTMGNTITQNSIFSNTMGIELASDANGDIAAPVIVTTNIGPVNVTGTACAGCTVELFANSDEDGEGETFVGDGVADSGGAFAIAVSAASLSTKPYLTATATDVVSGTSEFSEVYAAQVSCVFLPLVLRDF